MKKLAYIEKPIRELPRGLPTMNDRIEYIRCTLGYPISTFAIKVGSSKSSMKKVLEGKTPPHMKIILNILQIFPVEKEFMYIGTGQPYTTDDLTEYMFDNQNSKQQDDIDIQVAERFREIRLDAGLSQPVFAAAVGATKDMVAFIETGRTALSIALAKRVAKKYNINYQWFMDGVGNKYRTKKV